MKDNYGRAINYMRISITDRCNLRCSYCMPVNGIDVVDMHELLTYEEITAVCKEAASLGINKIRITGGEPLVRRDAPKLIGMIKSVEGIEQVNLTTNGSLLPQFLPELIDNGLDGVNISLDANDKLTYKDITGKDMYAFVMDGIRQATEAGLKVKINTVLLDNKNYENMLLFAKENPISVRFIELMPLGAAKNMQGADFNEVISYIDQNYPDWKWKNSSEEGDGPARYISIPDFKGKVGFISALHDKFCNQCNRIRMTATGEIKPCLCYGTSYDIKTALRAGDMETVRDILENSIKNKPSSHCFERPEEISEQKKMVSIGG